jgi:transforming growth factor-beta-induced protein
MKFSLALSALIAGSAGAQNIVEVAVSLPDLFSTLVTAVVAAGLDETLATTENITVFAPVNDAFADLPSDVVETLLTEPWKAHLQNLLTYHVLGSVVPSSAITGEISATTLNGEDVNVTLTSEGGVLVNFAANVVEADVLADNGIVHAIDVVLLPSWASNTIADRAIADPTLSTLVELVVQVDLVETLSSPGPFTVFAPDDAAFTQALEVLAQTLGLTPPLEDDLVSTILTYHVVSGIYPAGAISDGLQLMTVQGQNITFALSDSGATVNGQPITATDVLANNGIIHKIGGVLVPEGIIVSTTPPMEETPEEPVEGTEPPMMETEPPMKETEPPMPDSSASHVFSVACVASVLAGVMTLAL